MPKTQRLSGFTLIEILVVVALIAILTAITFIAINPARSFMDTRNTERSFAVGEILNAVVAYRTDPGHAIADFGNIPLCSTAAARIGSASGNINLAALLVDAYIVAIPLDPQPSGTAADTGYTICRTAENKIQIDAPNAEAGKVISVKR